MPITNFGSRPTPNPFAVALLGDSMTDQGSRDIQPPAANPARGWFTDGFSTWLRVLTNQRVYLPLENDFGISGDTLAQMNARVSSVLAVRPAYCIFMGGANDIGVNTYEAIRDSWVSTMKRLRAAGIRPVVMPVTPRAGTLLSAASLSILMRFTTFQRTYCWENGAIFVDTLKYLLDQTSTTNAPLPGMVRPDNLHPAAIGAYWMGKALADVFNQILPPAPTDFVSALDAYDPVTNPTGSLLRAGAVNRSTLAGTGGTLMTSTGFTPSGALAAGWQVIRSGTSTATLVCAKESPRLDGFSSGERQILTLSVNSVGTNDEIYNLRFPAVNHGVDTAAGDWIYGEAQIEVLSAPENITAIELQLVDNRPGNSQTTVDMGLSAQVAGFMPSVLWKGILRTPPFQIQPDSTSFLSNVRIRANATGGSAAVKIAVGHFAVRKA